VHHECGHSLLAGMMMFVEHSSEGYLPVRIVSEGHDGQTLVEGEICGINEQWWVSAATEQHRYDTLLNLAPDNLRASPITPMPHCYMHFVSAIAGTSRIHG